MSITVSLTNEQYHWVSRPVDLPKERCGGFQRLIYRLQEGLHWTPRGWTLSVSPRDARTVIAYANPKYGKGTYQNVTRSIAPLLAAALTAAGETTTGDLFEGEDDADPEE